MEIYQMMGFFFILLFTAIIAILFGRTVVNKYENEKGVMWINTAVVIFAFGGIVAFEAVPILNKGGSNFATIIVTMVIVFVSIFLFTIIKNVYFKSKK